MSYDLSASAKNLGFNGSLPQGATNIEKDGSGHFKITVNNEVKIFNADGSAATDNNPPRVAADNSGNRGTTNNNNNNSSIFSGTAVGGSVSVNPALFASAVNNTDALLSLAQNVPLGLGGQLTQNEVMQNLQQYMGALNFNFDLSNLSSQYPAVNMPTAYPTASQTSYGSSTGFVSGSTVVVVDGSQFTVDELAESNEPPLKKSAREGFYYDSDGNYYKFNMSSKEFVDATEREAKVAKNADDKVKEQNKADENSKKAAASAIKRQAADVCSDFFDAMDDGGTDEDKLKEVSKTKINKDNVIEVIDMWDDDYDADYDSDRLGFFGSIQDELSGDDQDEVEDNIANALCERAESLGLSDEATDLVTTIKSARKSRGSSKDKKVKEAFEKLVDAIKEAEAARRAEQAE